MYNIVMSYENIPYSEENMIESNVNNFLIPLDQIVERQVNDFSQPDIEQLKNSIREYGLIHPITVVLGAVPGKYVITSGHRRYKAFQALHQEYPEDKIYEKIAATVYVLTDDEEITRKNPHFISHTQEEGIYRDANLETRQLTEQDVLHHIDWLIKKIEGQEAKKEAIAYLEEQKGKVYRHSKKVNKPKFISDILTKELHLKGWGKTTVYYYLYIRDNAPNSLLKAVRDGQVSIKAAYQQLIPSNNHTVSKENIDLAKLKDYLEAELTSVKNNGLSENDYFVSREVVALLYDLHKELIQAQHNYLEEHNELDDV